MHSVQLTGMVIYNELHECLLAKDMTAFWSNWRTKFVKPTNASVIDGSTCGSQIAYKFADYILRMHAVLTKLFKLILPIWQTLFIIMQLSMLILIWLLLSVLMFVWA